MFSCCRLMCTYNAAIISLDGILTDGERALLREEQPVWWRGCAKSLLRTMFTAFSLLLRLTLCSSSASLSSLYRNFSLQTWEATSPASTCKYHWVNALVKFQQLGGPCTQDTEGEGLGIANWVP